MRFNHQTFEGQRIDLDSNEFVGCTFVNCHVIFRGSGPTSLISNRFDDCEFGLEGPAGLTLDFLANLWQAPGMRHIVERIFHGIRTGEYLAKAEDPNT